MDTPGSQRLHRALMRFAFTGAHVFSWVFIFHYYFLTLMSLSQAFVSVALTYALTQVIIVLSTPWAARYMRSGARRSVVYATLLASVSFILLGSTFAGVLGNAGAGIGFFAVLIGLYRAFYWVPYSVEASPTLSDPRVEFLLALVPLIAGFFVSLHPQGIIILLFSAAALCIAAILPLSRMRDQHEVFSWGYRESFHLLFLKANRPLFMHSIYDGVEGAALLLVWPIAIFILVNWSYASLGMILTATFLLTWGVKIVFQRFGILVPESIVVRTALAGSSWFMRLAVGTAPGVVIVDTYSRSGYVPRGIDLAAHEQAADNNTYVDELTALKEMGAALGRFAICMLVAILAIYFSYAVAAASVFVVAGFAAMLSVVLSGTPRATI